MSAARDYVACMIAQPRDLERAIAHASQRIEEHKCSVGQTVEWCCNPLPGGGHLLYASWPCEGAE